MTSNSPAPSDVIKGTFSGDSLGDKISKIQEHLARNHYGSRAIPLCMTNDGGTLGRIREWNPSDFVGQSVITHLDSTSDGKQKISPADWMGYENSTSQTGEYLLSQVLRYEATGDAEALTECSRALQCLRNIAALAGPKCFGWLCKPFGGRFSRESSPDQNLCVIVGIWTFLPHANREEGLWIKKLIEAIPRYWKSIGYTINFADRVWDIRKDIGHMRIYCMANHLAFHVSGKKAFLAEARKLERACGCFSGGSASLFDNFTEADPKYFKNWRVAGEFAGGSLLFTPLTLDVLFSIQPERKKDYLEALARCLDHGTIGLDQTLYGHRYFHEVKQQGDGYIWRPVEHRAADSLAYYRSKTGRWLLEEYPHGLLWFDATSRFPLAYLIYLKHGGDPLPSVDRIVREIMDRLDFNRLHWMVDPHNDQTPSELQYVLRAISSELPNYISAYWLGVSMKFWNP